jgi:hypothetical protein
MKRKRIAMFVAVGALALTLQAAPQGAATPEPTAPPVAALEGDGIWGEIVCYSCLGGAMASTLTAAPWSNLAWGKCLSFCAMSL